MVFTLVDQRSAAVHELTRCLMMMATASGVSLCLWPAACRAITFSSTALTVIRTGQDRRIWQAKIVPTREPDE